MSFELISSFNLIWLFLFIIKSNWFYTWSHFCLFSFKLKTCPFHPWFQYELTKDGVTESAELWNIPVVGFAELEEAVTLTLWVTVVSSASIFFTVEVFSRIMKLTITKWTIYKKNFARQSSRGWWSFFVGQRSSLFMRIVQLVSSNMVTCISLSFFIDVVVSVGLTRPVDDGLIDDNLIGSELGRSMSGISLSSSGVFFSSEYGSSISSSGSISNPGTSGASGTSLLVNETSGPFPVTSSGHGTYEQGASIRFRPAQNSFSITSTP